MKKFYARLRERDNAILIDGDRIGTDESFIYVFYEERLIGVFDRGEILYCHLTETKRSE